MIACYLNGWSGYGISPVWSWWYQRRTLTGTGLTKKTAHGCTGKNLRMEAAAMATSAIILAGFFCISQLMYALNKTFSSAK
jgi:hypothetical protein